MFKNEITQFKEQIKWQNIKTVSFARVVDARQVETNCYEEELLSASYNIRGTTLSINNVKLEDKSINYLFIDFKNYTKWKVVASLSGLTYHILTNDNDKENIFSVTIIL